MINNDKTIEQLNGGGYEDLSKECKIVIYKPDGTTINCKLSDLFSLIYDLFTHASKGTNMIWYGKDNLNKYI